MKPKKSSFSIKRFFTSFSHVRRFNALDARKRSIVFYSESGQDWHHFKRSIDTIIDNGYSVCYVSSDVNDPGLSLKKEQFHPFYVSEGFWQIYFFQTLKADCLILTMIDLHVFHLKRSIHPVHYIYLFHSISSTHMVDYANSYDHYDTILCVGPFQIEEIRARERLMNLPAKNCVPHGYARIEELMNDKRNTTAPPQEPYRILIAPTWGPHSILPVCGSALIKVLLDNNYRVTLRPHYQTNKLTPEVVTALLDSYGGHPNFSYVDRMGDTDSLFNSDLLICDWSSTSIEYALGLEKPVLYIDVPRRVRNERYMELGIEPLEVSIRSVVGEILSPDELDKAPQMITKLLADPERFRNNLRKFREKTVFNIGSSSDRGAAAIISIADQIRASRTPSP